MGWYSGRLVIEYRDGTSETINQIPTEVAYAIVEDRKSNDMDIKNALYFPATLQMA